MTYVHSVVTNRERSNCSCRIFYFVISSAAVSFIKLQRPVKEVNFVRTYCSG